MMATKRRAPQKWGFSFGFEASDENRTAKPRFDNKELTQVLAPSKRRGYMRREAL